MSNDIDIDVPVADIQVMMGYIPTANLMALWREMADDDRGPEFRQILVDELVSRGADFAGERDK